MELRKVSKMIAAHIEPILIVTGTVTAIAVILFVAPLRILRMISGATPTDAISVALARHWGLLIFCVGVLLIYAAFQPAVRVPAMIFAATEKVALGTGVLGTSLRRYAVAAAIAAGDSLFALVYIAYLTGF